LAEKTIDPVEVTSEQLADLFVLDALKGFGPQKFKILRAASLEPHEVVHDASRLPLPGKTGDKLRDSLSKMTGTTFAECRARALRQIEVARKHGAHILTYDHPAYPDNLLASSHPIPFLFARGNIGVLSNRMTVACVGSRGLRPPYDELHRVAPVRAFLSVNRELVLLCWHIGRDILDRQERESWAPPLQQQEQSLLQELREFLVQAERFQNRR
jgi:hypothetical protein